MHYYRFPMSTVTRFLFQELQVTKSFAKKEGNVLTPILDRITI